MAPRIPALPLDSHVRSHAEVFKNKLCEFPRSPHSESDRRWLDSTPFLPVTGGSFRDAKLLYALRPRSMRLARLA
jgi:hypothetical protein